MDNLNDIYKDLTEEQIEEAEKIHEELNKLPSPIWELEFSSISEELKKRGS